MDITPIMIKMIKEAHGHHHDINHFMKVHSFARTIGLKENLSQELQDTLELAAIVHDIACPLCREKYGNTLGKYQEQEGMILTRTFLEEFALPEEMVERIVYLVGHHHTLNQIDGIDYQILIEADYLVNADESQYPKQAIQNMYDQVFKTATGKQLLEYIYLKKDI